MLVEGELGAGKTTFVRGACRALGVTAVVTQPDVHDRPALRGPIPVAHVDLYRVDDLRSEDPDLLDDYLRPDTIAFVEWPQGAEADARRARADRPPGPARARRRGPPDRGDRMRILGFDTATRATAVALFAPDGLALEARDDPPPGERPRHTTRLLPLIVELLDAAGLGWDDLERVAVGVGPGTFTGLRIGIATARGLAVARGLPLVGVSTLESLALGGIDAVTQGRIGADVDAVAAVLDARRGEVFARPGHPIGDTADGALRARSGRPGPPTPGTRGRRPGGR